MKTILLAAAALAAATLLPQGAQSAEVRVFCTGAARAAFTELGPQFERAP